MLAKRGINASMGSSRIVKYGGWLISMSICLGAAKMTLADPTACPGTLRSMADAEELGVSRTAGLLSFDGVNPAVYGSFSGCGERSVIDAGSFGARIVSARSIEVRPLLESPAHSPRTEYFFDASKHAHVTPGVRADYSFSAYLSPETSAHAATTVSGSALALDALGGRLRLQSRAAVSHGDAEGVLPVAHSHRVDAVPWQGEAWQAVAAVEYSDAGPGFKADRSDISPGRRLLQVETTVRGPETEAAAGMSHGFDFDDDGNRTAAERRTWAQATQSLGALVPEPFSISIGGKLAQVERADAAGGADWREADWHVETHWKNDRAQGDLRLSGYLSDRQPRSDETVVRDGYRVNAGLATRVADWEVSSTAFGGYVNEVTFDDMSSLLAAGVIAKADWRDRGLSVSAAYEDRRFDQSNPGWRVGAGANIDPLRLIGLVDGENDGISAHGRIEAELDSGNEGMATNVRALFTARIKF